MILRKTETECFSTDGNRCRAMQISRRRLCLLASKVARRCRSLVTANGTTRPDISEGNNHQSRRLENLKFSLEVAKMHRNFDVKLLSAWKLRLVPCYADTSKLQGQWEPPPPPSHTSECCQVWTEIRPNLTTHSGLRRCRSGSRCGTALLRL
jgi:hypothetical protein